MQIVSDELSFSNIPHLGQKKCKANPVQGILGAQQKVNEDKRISKVRLFSADN